MSNNKQESASRLINLKGDDFMNEVPEALQLEVLVYWKGKGLESAFERINPVHSFGKVDGKIRVTNRNLLDTCYTFNVKEVKRVVIQPMFV